MRIEKFKLAAAWLLLAGAATLLRFKTVLQSDSLFLDSLFTDLFTHGGRWADWKFIQAPAFLPDMLLYLLAYPILPDAASRIFFVSAAQVLLLAAAVLWCARQISPQLGRPAQTALLVMLAFVTLVAARSNMWLYFYSTNNHLGATLFGLAAVGLLLRHLARPSRSGAVLLVLLIAAAQVSTRLFLLSFVVPLLALIALALIALPRRVDALRRHRKQAWNLLWVVLVSQLLAAALGALLIRNNPGQGHGSVSPDTVSNALKLFLQATGAAFSPDNRWTQALAILLLLALIYLGTAILRGVALAPDQRGLALRWQQAGFAPGIAPGIALNITPKIAPTITSGSTPAGTPGWRFGAAAALLFVALPLGVAGSVLSAGFVDLSAYRYFTFPLTLTVVLAMVLLDHRYGKRAAAWHAGALVLAAAVLAGGLQLARHHTPQTDPAKLVADCLTAIEAGGFRLQAGVGDYWNGSAVSYYLPRHNPVLVTLNDAAPLFWVSTLGPILRPNDYPAHQHSNFALLRDAGAGGPFDYTAQTIGKLLPPPSRVQACPAAQMQIWLYDGAQLDAAVARIKADFLAKGAARKRR